MPLDNKPAVAIGIFATHLVTLVLLVGAAFLKFGFDTAIFWQNMSTPPPGGIRADSNLPPACAGSRNGRSDRPPSGSEG